MTPTNRLFIIASIETNKKELKSWVNKDTPGIVPLTKRNFILARQFVWKKWLERAQDFGHLTPQDLSSSCVFSSIFCKFIFGGKIRGSYNHQYNLINGRIVDLSYKSADVQEIGNPHAHDPTFWANPQHLYSMSTCVPRVQKWVAEFKQIVGVA